MIRSNKRRLRQIGLIMIVASIVLFAVSVYLLSAGTSEYSVNSDPGKTVSFSKAGVSAGDDLTYKVSFHQNFDLVASLISQNGTSYSVITFNQLPTGTNTILAPSSGNWTLQIANDGGYNVNISVVYDSITHKGVPIAPGNYTRFYDPKVSSGSNLVYSMSPNQVGNITAMLLSPDGAQHSSIHLSSASSGSDTIIVPVSGEWKIQINNSGELPVNLSVSIGDASYAALGMTIFGFVLLPGGIAFLSAYAYALRRERKRKHLREFSE
ncbi:hypothetical protein IX51_04045 [uncultured archaeon]|nr:hypothetical protein IX51_04045 [uncultured archaeon]HKJ96809.1 hypothetical protein [Thermoplasmataceae archaeon]